MPAFHATLRRRAAAVAALYVSSVALVASLTYLVQVEMAYFATLVLCLPATLIGAPVSYHLGVEVSDARELPGSLLQVAWWTVVAAAQAGAILVLTSHRRRSATSAQSSEMT